MILLTPGPVTTSSRVRQAATATDLSHRDPTFARLLDETASGLRRVAGAPDHDAILFGGGATAATEAALGSLIPGDHKVLVPSNGAFGERMAEIARVLGLQVCHLRFEWGASIRVADVREALAGDPAIRAVAMVQHETSVGCLNPVAAVGTLASEAGATFFLDVVSSLGSEIFDAQTSRASVVIGAANKCLHGIPGVSFVLVHPDAWTASNHVRPRSIYSDLRQYREASGGRKIPFTPPVAPIAALHEALRELADTGGLPARRHRYLELNARLKSDFVRQGLEVFFDGPDASCSLSVAGLPNGQPFELFADALRRRGFVIYEAKGALRDRCFLVANMGHLDMATIDRFLEALRDVLADADGQKGPVAVSGSAGSRPLRRT